MNVWGPLMRAFQKGDMEEGVRIFLNGVLGEGTFDKLPIEARSAAMENAQALKDETLSPGHFSSFSCGDAKKIKVPTLLLTGELSPPMFPALTNDEPRTFSLSISSPGISRLLDRKLNISCAYTYCPEAIWPRYWIEKPLALQEVYTRER